MMNNRTRLTKITLKMEKETSHVEIDPISFDVKNIEKRIVIFEFKKINPYRVYQKPKEDLASKRLRKISENIEKKKTSTHKIDFKTLMTINHKKSRIVEILNKMSSNTIIEYLCPNTTSNHILFQNYFRKGVKKWY